MKRQFRNLSRRYRVALQAYLRQGSAANLESAHGLGKQAFSAGLQTLDLAKLHEQILVTEVLSACPAKQRSPLIKQAGVFFAAAITSIGKTPPHCLCRYPTHTHDASL